MAKKTTAAVAEQPAATETLKRVELNVVITAISSPSSIMAKATELGYARRRNFCPT